MELPLLDKVNSPEDLKKLSGPELDRYATEVRALITRSVIKNGGHLASSLGAVELCIALHLCYNAPYDSILFDVGHQAYAHKIITGRKNGFSALRNDEGISGFCKPSESEYDAFISGHASNSLSAALGLWRANKMAGTDKKTVSVIGDGALTGGMAFEALNDIGAEGADMLIVLNDNNMSISKNVGAMSRYFSRLRISKSYLNFKRVIKKGVSALPLIGGVAAKVLEKSKGLFRSVFKVNRMFEQMGIRYYGPYDGNRIGDIKEVLCQAKEFNGPVLVHLLTQKGCGFLDAEQNPSVYHGLSPAGSTFFESYGKVAGDTLCSIAANDETLCCVTAAMADGTGLSGFLKRYPDKCFDVGIAEEHAVTMAAGLAAGGAKPFVCIYSSFLQRAFDQIMHDVCIPGLAVTFLIDRAGANEGDGVTHQGVFDLPYLSLIPDLAVLTPKDGEELAAMIRFAQNYQKPLAIRYPKSFEKNYGKSEPIAIGKWETVCESDLPCVVLAAGNRMLDIALKTKGATVVNARCVKPLDTGFLDSAGKKGARLITLEDGSLSGGFGQSVLSYISRMGYKATVTALGFSDNFLHTHSVSKAFSDSGLTAENLQNIINKKILA